MSASDNWTVDKLLKKVYSVHKQTLNDISAELVRCKENLQRSEEEVKELQTENEHLCIENKRLSVVEGNKQSSYGSCCEVIRHSLQMVNTSYKELLKDKDQRIKHLEEELNKYKRRFLTADSIPWSATEVTVQDDEKNRRSTVVGNSPDSTSKLTPATKNSGPGLQPPFSPIPSRNNTEISIAGETVSDKSPDDTQKLRLQRRGKRSRYSEDVSPEMKRPRHKSGSKQSKKVLVHDTCNHSENTNNPDTNQTCRQVKRRSNLEETVLVVPETMAVDDDYIDDHLDDEDIASSELPLKLSTLEEMSETAVSVSSNREGQELGMHKYVGNQRKFGQDKLSLDTDGFTPRDLQSLEGDDDVRDDGNDSLYEAISDIGASVVDDSDDNSNKSPPNECAETSYDEILCDLDTTHRSHPLGGRCKDIGEVNELFETPEGKSNTKSGTKRLFKKCVQADEVKLRRSPRKNKELNAGSKIDRRKHSVSQDVDKSKGTRNSQRNGCPDNHDLTIAPDMNTSIETQSMDLYQVVPVKNGEPVIAKQFQMKVRKNKYDAKGRTNNAHRSVDTMKSPVVGAPGTCSVFDTKLKGSKVTEIITVSSSPSVGSLSDPDSPLLLKTNKSDKKETNNGQPGQSRSKEESLIMSPSKVTRSRLSSSHTSTKQSKNGKPSKGQSVALPDVDEVKGQGDSPRSKSLRQTTLTQRFFSPNKKQAKIFKSNFADGNNKKTLTFDEVSNGEEDVVVTDEDFSFKRPTNPANKETLSVKRRGKIQVNLDETVHPSERDSHALHDISSKHLNGSLDPAAELSMLCGEPGSPENQPIRSLPSLDTDFCADDLVSDQASLQKTSTLEGEESEDIPASYRFMPKNKPSVKPSKENIHVSLDDSFDRPPKKAVDNVAHIAVVRKKEERQKLQGYGCKQCEEYYKSTGRSEADIKSHMNQCSRHRAQYLPPDTPPHFWSVGFIDTQECVDRGYMKIDENQQKKGEDGNPYRRRRRLNKYFKSKTEGSADGSDEELVYE